METFVEKIGIDWKLVASQAANFLILLFILRTIIYKPLVRILRERQEKIATGLAHADEASRRLSDVQHEVRAKLQDADARAVALMKDTEHRAREKEAKLLEATRAKEDAERARFEDELKARETAFARELEREGALLITRALAKAVDADPRDIDAKLVERATRELHRS